jgi:hypothetical protein
VVTWGYSNCPGNVVPSNLAGVKAVAAGWLHSVVLLTNGTVRAWGDNYYGQTNVPPDLTNVTAISACSRHNLALKSDGTVEGWGYNYDGITTTPTGLSNVVAIATGYVNSLALKADGTVVVWGDNSAGQCNVPTGLSNVMALAAGWYHCAAMKNDGTVVSWGDNSAGQTNVPAALVNAKLLAAAGSHTLAGVFSPLVQYPVDVTKDVLLIYNSNSTNSVALKDYYLAHRPMITGINVLSIACDAGESTTSTNCNAQIMTPVLNWLTNNPTKRPQYVILSFEIPTRLSDLIVNGNLTTNYGNYGSVSYHLHNNLLPGWQPFVNNLNANTLADCEGYVHKLEFIGTNCSPGKLIISASAGGYGNTNFYPDGFESSYFAQTYNALIASGASSNSIISHLPTEPPITNGVNVAGYASTGFYRFSGDRFYPIDGKLKWSGNSGWWIIVTGNSFSGIRDGLGIQDSFTEWFASNAFGGTNYSCTPIGATGATEEPGGGTQNDARIYFPFWQSRKNFAICAWNSRQTPYFQAIGDPLITR